VPLTVRALASGMVGTFAGTIGRAAAANTELGGLMQLQTTASGAFTLKVRSGAKTQSAKGFLQTTAPQVVATIHGELMSLSLDAGTGLVSGTHGTALVSGWRGVWDAKVRPTNSREGYYSVALDLADAGDDGVVTVPQGSGFAAFAITTGGAVRLTGKTADGQALTGASVLGEMGQVAVYAALYRGQGSLVGEWAVEEDLDGNFAGNQVSGTLDWMKSAMAGRAYASGFGPLNLRVEGAYLAPTSRGGSVLGLPQTGEFAVRFLDGGLADSETDPDVSGMLWTDLGRVVTPASGHAGRLVMKVMPKTGAVSGSFTLTETQVPVVRKGVKFFGQVVRLADTKIKAVGFFLLPQLPQSGEKANATAILSGAVRLEQPDVP
jgi:hypothetical protein